MLKKFPVTCKGLLILAMFALLGGCASFDLREGRPLPISRNEGLVLMAVDIHNERAPKFPFDSFGVDVRDPATGTPQTMRVASAKGATAESFLLVMRLPAGAQLLSTLVARTLPPPMLGPGQMSFGVEAPFTVTAGQVRYLGHFDLRNVDKTSGDDQNSSMGGIPNIPNGVTGLTRGTMRVAITDAFAHDVPLFIQSFPALKTATIEDAPLEKLLVKRASTSSADPIPVLLQR